MNKHPHVILVSQFEPSPDGHGGNHRTYQIAHDLAGLIGEDKLSTMSLNTWRKTNPRKTKRKPHYSMFSSPPSNRSERLGHLIAHRLPFLRAAHPVDLLRGQWEDFDFYAASDFKKAYEETVKRLPRPLVCIMENAAFGHAVLPVNQAARIPTVGCPQNIESLDRAIPFPSGDQRRKGLASLAFADEWGVLGQCAAVLTISRIEEGLLRGLGLNAENYPYRPVGAIAEYWQHIRRTRATKCPSPHTLAMLGSCSHLSTRLSTERLLAMLAMVPEMKDYRFIIAGSDSETLVIPPPLAGSVECRGRISNSELEALLLDTTAMLVSQNIGFGALTRLSEFTCAGIPVVASEFTKLTMDPPPGIRFTPDTADSWSEAIREATTASAPLPSHDYETWAAHQAIPFATTLAGMAV